MSLMMQDKLLWWFGGGKKGLTSIGNYINVPPKYIGSFT
jgi:hypothetical protein